MAILTFAALFQIRLISKTGNQYLLPRNFPRVPATVRTQLEKAHCLVPQDVETTTPHNVVSGELARRGQQDWAAYCSVGGKSRVIVIWGGRTKCEGDPFGFNEPINDDSIYQTADPAQFGRMPPRGAFWLLSVVPQREVVARQKVGIAEGLLLSSASHDALQRSSPDAGGNGVYCNNGKWRAVWYAD